MADQGGRFRLPNGAHDAGMTLRVSNLARSADFYSRLVGLRVEDVSETDALLRGRSEHETTLRLIESPDAPSRAQKSAGLFHAAFRYPGRGELAGAVMRFVQERYPLDGAADHLVSDAIYLRDPDGNGVELYADRAPSEWPRKGGELVMSTEALDVEALLSEAKPGQQGVVDLGHVHLQVTDLPRSEQFYCNLIGFDVTQRSFPGALFLSAGGYHHHVGLNIWSSRRGSAVDPGALGLIRFTVATGDRAAVEAVRRRLEQAGLPHAVQGDDQEHPALVVRDPDNIEVEIGV